MLMPGDRVGPYEVAGPLGAGGMGEVYRARDTALNRDVAIKILPDALAQDAERLARFRREAQVLASLNHSHIAQIHGFDESGGTRALVMELVDGEDLVARIARGALPLDDALPIARQVAEALEAAHEQGIVHRDLKPANIKVRPDGIVKVLDFGLAKALDVAGGATRPSDLLNSPTITSPAALTMGGAILGTAAYMAPEQARGRTVDRRADIWAFGCVLYEMLTGRRAFAGTEISDVLAEVIKSEPDWMALPTHTPPSIHRLLRRCLAKDPRQRLADASVARLEIDEALRAPEEDRSRITSAAVSRRPERLAWSMVAVAALVAAAAAAVAISGTFSNRPAAPPEARLHLAVSGTDPAVSPDGRWIAYIDAAERGPGRQLWIRPLDADTARPLSGTEQIFDYFWSADSASIAFFAAQKLKRIDIATGAVRTLADAPTPRSGAWGADGTILFAPGGNGPIYRISAGGGEPQPVTTLREQDASHRHPEFLPDSRQFLFWVLGPPGVRGEYVGSFDSPEIRRLFDADGPATRAGEHVFFVREGVLYAQPFDLAAVTVRGEPMPVASNVSAEQTGRAPMSVSASGVIVYRPDRNDRRQLTWYDRSGKPIGTIGEPLTNLIEADLSDDGRMIALALLKHGSPDIWLMETARGTLTLLAPKSNRPVWSPDGRRVAFQSGRDGFGRLYWKSVGASESDELLYRSAEAQNMNDWSADGQHILFTSQSPTRARDIWVLPVAGTDRTPKPFVQSASEETSAVFSPDGRWVAYVSLETGTPEIYVRAFPGPGPAWRISTSSGSAPLWRRDGRELYYRSGGQAMAVAIRATPDGTIEAGTPAPLFPLRGGDLVSATDGQRFLVAAAIDTGPPPPLTVIVNWTGRGAAER